MPFETNYSISERYFFFHEIKNSERVDWCNSTQSEQSCVHNGFISYFDRSAFHSRFIPGRCITRPIPSSVVLAEAC
jgi:hypothetical protein